MTICFSDETWECLNDGVHRTWVDPMLQKVPQMFNTCGLLAKPTPQPGRGKRVIVLDAITKDGFVPNARRVYDAIFHQGDYHSEISSSIFLDWIKETFIDNPEVQGEWCLVLDNAGLLVSIST